MAKNAKSEALKKKMKGASSFTKEALIKHWSSEKPMENKGQKYRVGKMSYGDYFAEPYNPKHPEGRGERDNGGMHRSDTRWFERHPNEKRAKRGEYILR